MGTKEVQIYQSWNDNKKYEYDIIVRILYKNISQIQNYKQNELFQRNKPGKFWSFRLIVARNRKCEDYHVSCM